MKTRTPTQNEDARRWYEPFVPPGMNIEGELLFFLISMLAALTYSGGFLVRLFAELELLYTRTGGVRELIPGAVMAPFYVVFNQAWMGYFVVLLCMLGYGVWHGLYYRQDAKSIYTMRRLPDHISFLRYTWATTACAVLLCLLTALLCMLLSYGIYHWATPGVCLERGQWTLFWENLFYRE